jgi:hypothetical protein
MSTLTNDTDGFAGTCAGARSAWLGAVTARGREVCGLPHPDVDLNRNFIDIASMPAPHTGFAELRTLLMLDCWDEAG